MKKIGIDARLYFQTGIGTYLQNLLFYLDKKNPKKEVYYIYLRKQDSLKINFKSKNIVKKVADQKWHSFSEQTSFLLSLLKDDLDLMHFTYFSYPIFYWRKFVATVHDTTPLLFKTGKASTKNHFIYRLKHFFLKIVVRLQIERAVQIITPTNTVKNQLIDIYGAKIAGKTLTIYEGVSHTIFGTKENNLLDKKFKDFFLYVGNFYPHKNVERLIDAFGKVSSKYTLILVGPNDYFTERISRYIRSSKFGNRIVLLKNPPTSDLVFFYKNTEAIVHPSLSEGFGLPLLEAAYFGRPIIASNIDVFRELWKDQYVAFDPSNVEDISNKLVEFIRKRSSFSFDMFIKKYSFEKMTEETIKIYHKVTQNS
ncbi:glycosyltransferase family 4 protein [Candidatus Roizmanbacteria bacterium]|nr:glycosyltransferase family 4 protein [Candidatus Roizmanbacteria bacterium]